MVPSEEICVGFFFLLKFYFPFQIMLYCRRKADYACMCVDELFSLVYLFFQAKFIIDKIAVHLQPKQRYVFAVILDSSWEHCWCWFEGIVLNGLKFSVQLRLVNFIGHQVADKSFFSYFWLFTVNDLLKFLIAVSVGVEFFYVLNIFDQLHEFRFVHYETCVLASFCEHIKIRVTNHW